MAERPRIDSIELWLVFPAYAGIPDTERENPLKNGNIKVPQGTGVRFRAMINKAVVKAELCLKTKGGETRRRLSIQEQDVLEGEFPVREDTTYHFALLDGAGLANRNPIVYTAETIPDLPPRVDIPEPGHNKEVTERASVKLLISVKDDYGLKGAALRYRILPASAKKVEKTIPLAMPEGKRLKLEIAHLFELADLRLKVGYKVMYRAEAWDYRGRDPEGQYTGTSD